MWYFPDGPAALKQQFQTDQCVQSVSILARTFVQHVVSMKVREFWSSPSVQMLLANAHKSTWCWNTIIVPSFDKEAIITINYPFKMVSCVLTSPCVQVASQVIWIHDSFLKGPALIHGFLRTWKSFKVVSSLAVWHFTLWSSERSDLWVQCPGWRRSKFEGTHDQTQVFKARGPWGFYGFYNVLYDVVILLLFFRCRKVL